MPTQYKKRSSCYLSKSRDRALIRAVRETGIRELERRTGISKTTISRWICETGTEKRPGFAISTERAAAILAACGVDNGEAFR